MKNLIKFTFLCITMIGYTQNQLFIPSTITSTSINLDLQNGSHQFYAGQNTATMGVNGNLLGPTLIINKGSNLDINVTNNLGQPTTIHWHGLHVSPSNDSDHIQ